jgi:hypothetical protein
MTVVMTQKITTQDFRKALKQNRFIDKDSKVRRTYDGTDGFEVVTGHAMNIGNLIEIEKRGGFSVYYVEPHPEGMRVIFGNVYPRR